MKISILILTIVLSLLVSTITKTTKGHSSSNPTIQRNLNEGPHHRETHPEEGRHLGTVDVGTNLPGVQFENGEEKEKMENYKKISEDLAVFEEEYSNCIKEIEDSEYTQEKIDECVGRNFIKVVLDIKYITLKIMAKLDTKVRKMFIQECYEPAGVIEEFSVGCDVLEKDVLDMMWNGLEFVELVEINKEKYLFEYGKIPNDNYRLIFVQLEILSKEFFGLLDEVDSHKEVIILRLKTLIDDRTKLILEKASEDENFIRAPESGIHHTIEITETIIPEDPHHDERKLNQQKSETAIPKKEFVDKSIAVEKVVDKAKRLDLQDRLDRNKVFKKQIMVNKLSDTMRKQGKMEFKNVHTAHYQHGKH